MRKLTFVLACALAAAACSGGSGQPDGGTSDVDAGTPTSLDGGSPDAGNEPPDAGPPSLEVFVPATVEVRQGTTADVAVNLSFDVGRLGPATVTVLGTDADLSATSEPEKVDGRLPPVVHVHASDGAAPGPRKLTIKAVAGELTKSADITVQVSAFAGIDGLLVDQHGQPMRSVLVRAGSATTLSDDSGRFFFEKATPPYDLDLVVGEDHRAYRFQGLTRRDPQVQLAGTHPVANAWAFEGTFSGAFVPPPDDAAFWFSLDAPRVRAKARAVAVTGNAYANTKFDFFGAPSTSGRLWALEAKLDPARARVVGYYGFGEQPVSPVAGQRIPGMSFRLNPVDTTSISGKVTVPEGFSLSAMRTWLSHGGDAGLSLRLLEENGTGGMDPDTDADDALDDAEHIPADHPQTNQFVYPVPNANGFHLSLVATATSDRKISTARRIGLVPGDTAASVVLPVAPSISAPELDARVPVDGSFQWEDDAARVYVVSWSSGNPDDTQVTLVTTAKNAQLPDFSALGVQPPTETPMTFTVMAVEPYASVDDAASPKGLRYDHLLPTKSGRGNDRDGATALDRVPFVFATPEPP